MVQISRFDPNALQKFESHGGHYTSWEDLKFDDPACVAGFSVKRKEDDISAPWHLWNDEVWYVVEGEMDLTWRSPPMFMEEHRAHVTVGDVLLLKTGTQFWIKVLSDVPARLLWVSMPRPRYFGNEDFWGAKPTLKAERG
mgnify:CR=1 FL=1